MKASDRREMAQRERALAHRQKQQHKREQRRQQKLARKDWEPEKAWGTPDDFRQHLRFGGTREDY